MTSPSLDDVQVAIKHALETIEDLRAYATEPDQLPGSFAAVAYPRLIDWTYDDSWSESFDDISMLWNFDVWVLVLLGAGTARAQTVLNPYIAPIGRKSIKAALEREPSLGGVINYVRVTGGGAYGTADVAGVRCLAASMRAEVRA